MKEKKEERKERRDIPRTGNITLNSQMKYVENEKEKRELYSIDS